MLREAELWAATAAVRRGTEYPAAEIKRLWHLVLLQQFHDILPGSSIAWVHQDAERNYAAIAVSLEQIIADSMQALVGEGDTRFQLQRRSARTRRGSGARRRSRSAQRGPGAGDRAGRRLCAGQRDHPRRDRQQRPG
ncbi:hypothetical protein, partial [Neisseria meningitidis]|uniref:hypothetical protein n=1 Tax=Neisseria meningitidis TaxID=487 RepID=UPI003AADE893